MLKRLLELILPSEDTVYKRNLIETIVKEDPSRSPKELSTKEIGELEELLNTLLLEKGVECKGGEERVAREIFRGRGRRRGGGERRRGSSPSRFYERFVGEYLERRGYIVKYSSIERGRRKGGIDLIGVKREELLLVRCERGRANQKFGITRRDIERFLKETEEFLQKNPQYRGYRVKRILVTPRRIGDPSATAFLKEQRELVEYLYLPLPTDYRGPVSP
ncbi:MAG: YraN family protein [Epsilonproteobacteria bacterium]|nr:hypothetical protein [Campylobacterota bacterium]NPA56257.1 YraN family protein [Campylobacterota bacterium]